MRESSRLVWSTLGDYPHRESGPRTSWQPPARLPFQKNVQGFHSEWHGGALTRSSTIAPKASRNGVRRPISSCMRENNLGERRLTQHEQTGCVFRGNTFITLGYIAWSTLAAHPHSRKGVGSMRDKAESSNKPCSKQHLLRRLCR